MQIVRPNFTNNILKLERDFYFGYHSRAKVFCISLEGIDGCIVDVTLERTISWDDWKVVNNEFEEFLQSKISLHHLMGKMFHVWDGNHRLQA